ncbi:LOW QUALITY PROTEIN: clathrin heavy chain linker domain-containing protein 1 [Amphiprion ocellaris]|uniref:LOW QUALITY PROTEIN: clathrin heavy chain linker domain-containing protein 1 n=1 Tax=Amphiprion ocellaris TaxID=80972 RepID=UPI002410C6C1|nr:LOW QUALITY PROTEIN: clathrin heavy chain linker domain-containing protein 1 [Amphiprion ocellaris]
MSETKNCRSSSSTLDERVFTPDILVSESDEKFFRSLYEFIEHEKKYLQSPEEGPDELRYIIYRSVFHKVIGRATAYKRLLLTIKAEYDDTIKELKRREDEVQAAQRSELSSMSQVESLMTCRRRAAQLTNRISILQTKTAELEDQINRLKSSRDQSSWIPGVTVAQSYHLDFLDQHLEELKSRRAALMDTKSRCVPLDVRNKMDVELQSAERRREKLNTENRNLRILYIRLKKVCDRLSSWEEEEEKVPLEELISSTLDNIRQTDTVLDKDPRRFDAELFESQEPKGLDESILLRAHLDRFMELFDSAQYEEAAVLAARNPPGVLRNLDTMEMFKGVSGPPGSAPPGSAPPSLLFFRALLISVQTGGELSADLSLQGVICALQQGDLRLVVYAVTQNILTFSEELGDVLTEHAQKNSPVADTCLALATVVYQACGLHRKSALSMCRRGLIHGAAEFMKHCSDVTAGQCVGLKQYPRRFDAELFESQEPKGLDESILLRAHLDRFMELFDSAQYEEAAVLAARNPPGVLRNLDTMEMFKGVSGPPGSAPPGSAPPSLLFFRALLISVQTGGELSADLSLQGVICALQQGDLRLVVYAVTQNILTFSEELGDVLTEHAQKNSPVADTCLALATVVYQACGLHRKSALSMCRRGLIHGAAEFMKHCSDVTAEDCMWLLCRSPSLSLLQLLMEPPQGRAAILSVGVACVALLVDPQHQQLALQLLDSFICRGPGVLQEAILEDAAPQVDVWNDVASLCSGLNRADLSRAVLSVLLEQSGTRILSPDLQGAELMEHIFL